MTEPRILYVDDDAGLRRLAQRALERRGFAVATAESAADGMARLAAERFDLVAVDNHMPGRSGREMLDDIVALPDHPPVVFVTGNDDTQVAVEALHAGALDFVVKTVGESFFDILAGRFRQALSRADLVRQKQATDRELREANERLEMLVREVHHRVANSLQMVASFVSIQANATEDPAACAALEATQNRIKAVSRVHQNLYTRGDLSTIDLDSYLETLVAELRGGFADHESRVTLAVKADHCEVAPDEAVAVGIIVTECVSNALKYAFPDDGGGCVEVILRCVPGAYQVEVRDDGRGIAANAQPQGTGLGMRIVKASVRTLGGTFETSDCAPGTCQQLTVPRGKPDPSG